MNGSVRVASASILALPLSYSPVDGEIGFEPMTKRLEGVYANAIRGRYHSMVDPAGFEPATSAVQVRHASICAIGLEYRHGGSLPDE